MSSHLPLVEQPPITVDLVDESEAEDDVDQLDSDSAGEESPSASNRPNHVAGTRIPGESLLPTIRLENIIQADGTPVQLTFLAPECYICSGVTGNLALSKEGLFILSVAAVCHVSTSILLLLNLDLTQGGVHQEIGSGRLPPGRVRTAKCDQIQRYG